MKDYKEKIEKEWIEYCNNTDESKCHDELMYNCDECEIDWHRNKLIEARQEIEDLRSEER